MLIELSAKDSDISAEGMFRKIWTFLAVVQIWPKSEKNCGVMRGRIGVDSMLGYHRTNPANSRGNCVRGRGPLRPSKLGPAPGCEYVAGGVLPW